MSLLILGIALFWASHLFKILMPASRAALAGRLGDGPVKGLVAALTVLAIVLIVIGYQRAPFVNLWHPPGALIHLNNLLMLVAVAVFIAGSFKSGLRRRIRHPQLTAVKIWAVAHLLVNGDLASVLLFGSMLAWAVVAVIGINRRDGVWERPAPGTSRGALLHAVATVAVTVVVIVLHGLAGVSPVPGGA